jgi:hypothetical protein
MKKSLLTLPAFLAMAAASLLADPIPALTVQEVSTKDPEAYVAMIAKINALAKARIGVERYRHVWVGDFAGESSHALFVVSSFASAADVYQTQEKLKRYPEMEVLLEQLKGTRHLGSNVLYKTVRNDGVYEGGAVFNTSINCTDEAAYLKELDGLKAIFDANGFKDAKINLYREVAGRTSATHLVVISLPTTVRVGELLDALSDKDLLKDWYISAARFRTTLGNGTFHEIAK